MGADSCERVLVIRPFEAEKDYETVCKWWRAWSWTPLPLHALPKYGAIISDGHKDLYAGWLVRTDSSVCLLEWFIGNPLARESTGALEQLIEYLTAEAKAQGFLSAVVMARNPHLIRKLKRCGYEVRDTNTDLLFREI